MQKSNGWRGSKTGPKKPPPYHLTIGKWFSFGATNSNYRPDLSSDTIVVPPEATSLATVYRARNRIINSRLIIKNGRIGQNELESPSSPTTNNQHLKHLNELNHLELRYNVGPSLVKEPLLSIILNGSDHHSTLQGHHHLCDSSSISYPSYPIDHSDTTTTTTTTTISGSNTKSGTSSINQDSGQIITATTRPPPIMVHHLNHNNQQKEANKWKRRRLLETAATCCCIMAAILVFLTYAVWPIQAEQGSQIMTTTVAPNSKGEPKSLEAFSMLLPSDSSSGSQVASSEKQESKNHQFDAKEITIEAQESQQHQQQVAADQLPTTDQKNFSSEESLLLQLLATTNSIEEANQLLDALLLQSKLHQQIQQQQQQQQQHPSETSNISDGNYTSKVVANDPPEQPVDFGLESVANRQRAIYQSHVMSNNHHQIGPSSAKDGINSLSSLSNEPNNGLNKNGKIQTNKRQLNTNIKNKSRQKMATRLVYETEGPNAGVAYDDVENDDNNETNDSDNHQNQDHQIHLDLDQGDYHQHHHHHLNNTDGSNNENDSNSNATTLSKIAKVGLLQEWRLAEPFSGGLGDRHPYELLGQSGGDHSTETMAHHAHQPRLTVMKPQHSISLPSNFHHQNQNQNQNRLHFTQPQPANFRKSNQQQQVLLATSNGKPLLLSNQLNQAQYQTIKKDLQDFDLESGSGARASLADQLASSLEGLLTDGSGRFGGGGGGSLLDKTRSNPQQSAIQVGSRYLNDDQVVARRPQHLQNQMHHVMPYKLSENSFQQVALGNKSPPIPIHEQTKSFNKKRPNQSLVGQDRPSSSESLLGLRPPISSSSSISLGYPSLSVSGSSSSLGTRPLISGSAYSFNNSNKLKQSKQQQQQQQVPALSVPLEAQRTLSIDGWMSQHPFMHTISTMIDGNSSGTKKNVPSGTLIANYSHLINHERIVMLPVSSFKLPASLPVALNAGYGLKQQSSLETSQSQSTGGSSFRATTNNDNNNSSTATATAKSMATATATSVLLSDRSKSKPLLKGPTVAPVGLEESTQHQDLKMAIHKIADNLESWLPSLASSLEPLGTDSASKRDNQHQQSDKDKTVVLSNEEGATGQFAGEQDKAISDLLDELLPPVLRWDKQQTNTNTSSQLGNGSAGLNAHVYSKSTTSTTTESSDDYMGRRNDSMIGTTNSKKAINMIIASSTTSTNTTSTTNPLQETKVFGANEIPPKLFSDGSGGISTKISYSIISPLVNSIENATSDSLSFHHPMTSLSEPEVTTSPTIATTTTASAKNKFSDQIATVEPIFSIATTTSATEKLANITPSDGIGNYHQNSSSLEIGNPNTIISVEGGSNSNLMKQSVDLNSDKGHHRTGKSLAINLGDFLFGNNYASLGVSRTGGPVGPILPSVVEAKWKAVRLPLQEHQLDSSWQQQQQQHYLEPVLHNNNNPEEHHLSPHWSDSRRTTNKRRSGASPSSSLPLADERIGQQPQSIGSHRASGMFGKRLDGITSTTKTTKLIGPDGLTVSMEGNQPIKVVAPPMQPMMQLMGPMTTNYSSHVTPSISVPVVQQLVIGGPGEQYLPPANWPSTPQHIQPAPSHYQHQFWLHKQHHPHQHQYYHHQQQQLQQLQQQKAGTSVAGENSVDPIREDLAHHINFELEQQQQPLEHHISSSSNRANNEDMNKTTTMGITDLQNRPILKTAGDIIVGRPSYYATTTESTIPSSSPVLIQQQQQQQQISNDYNTDQNNNSFFVSSSSPLPPTTIQTKLFPITGNAGGGGDWSATTQATFNSTNLYGSQYQQHHHHPHIPSASISSSPPVEFVYSSGTSNLNLNSNSNSNLSLNPLTTTTNLFASTSPYSLQPTLYSAVASMMEQPGPIDQHRQRDQQDNQHQHHQLEHKQPLSIVTNLFHYTNTNRTTTKPPVDTVTLSSSSSLPFAPNDDGQLPSLSSDGETQLSSTTTMASSDDTNERIRIQQQQQQQQQLLKDVIFKDSELKIVDKKSRFKQRHNSITEQPFSSLTPPPTGSRRFEATTTATVLGSLSYLNDGNRLNHHNQQQQATTNAMDDTDPISIVDAWTDRMKITDEKAATTSQPNRNNNNNNVNNNNRTAISKAIGISHEVYDQGEGERDRKDHDPRREMIIEAAPGTRIAPLTTTLAIERPIVANNGQQHGPQTSWPTRTTPLPTTTATGDGALSSVTVVDANEATDFGFETEIEVEAVNHQQRSKARQQQQQQQKSNHLGNSSLVQDHQNHLVNESSSSSSLLPTSNFDPSIASYQGQQRQDQQKNLTKASKINLDYGTTDHSDQQNDDRHWMLPNLRSFNTSSANFSTNNHSTMHNDADEMINIGPGESTFQATAILKSVKNRNQSAATLITITEKERRLKAALAAAANKERQAQQVVDYVGSFVGQSNTKSQRRPELNLATTPTSSSSNNNNNNNLELYNNDNNRALNWSLSNITANILSNNGSGESLDISNYQSGRNLFARLPNAHSGPELADGSSGESTNISNGTNQVNNSTTTDHNSNHLMSLGYEITKQKREPVKGRSDYEATRVTTGSTIAGLGFTTSGFTASNNKHDDRQFEDGSTGIGSTIENAHVTTTISSKGDLDSSNQHLAGGHIFNMGPPNTSKTAAENQYRLPTATNEPSLSQLEQQQQQVINSTSSLNDEGATTTAIMAEEEPTLGPAINGGHNGQSVVGNLPQKELSRLAPIVDNYRRQSLLMSLLSQGITQQVATANGFGDKDRRDRGKTESGSQQLHNKGQQGDNKPTSEDGGSDNHLMLLLLNDAARKLDRPSIGSSTAFQGSQSHYDGRPNHNLSNKQLQQQQQRIKGATTGVRNANRLEGGEFSMNSKGIPRAVNVTNNNFNSSSGQQVLLANDDLINSFKNSNSSQVTTAAKKPKPTDYADMLHGIILPSSNPNSNFELLATSDSPKMTPNGNNSTVNTSNISISNTMKHDDLISKASTELLPSRIMATSSTSKMPPKIGDSDSLAATVTPASPSLSSNEFLFILGGTVNGQGGAGGATTNKHSNLHNKLLSNSLRNQLSSSAGAILQSSQSSSTSTPINQQAHHIKEGAKNKESSSKEEEIKNKDFVSSSRMRHELHSSSPSNNQPKTGAKRTKGSLNPRHRQLKGPLRPPSLATTISNTINNSTPQPLNTSDPTNQAANTITSSSTTTTTLTTATTSTPSDGGQKRTSSPQSELMVDESLYTAGIGDHRSKENLRERVTISISASSSTEATLRASSTSQRPSSTTDGIISRDSSLRPASSTDKDDGHHQHLNGRNRSIPKPSNVANEAESEQQVVSNNGTTSINTLKIIDDNKRPSNATTIESNVSPPSKETHVEAASDRLPLPSAPGTFINASSDNASTGTNENQKSIINDDAGFNRTSNGITNGDLGDDNELESTSGQDWQVGAPISELPTMHHSVSVNATGISTTANTNINTQESPVIITTSSIINNNSTSKWPKSIPNNSKSNRRHRNHQKDHSQQWRVSLGTNSSTLDVATTEDELVSPSLEPPPPIGLPGDIQLDVIDSILEGPIVQQTTSGNRINQSSPAVTINSRNQRHHINNNNGRITTNHQSVSSVNDEHLIRIDRKRNNIQSTTTIDSGFGILGGGGGGGGLNDATSSHGGAPTGGLGGLMMDASPVQKLAIMAIVISCSLSVFCLLFVAISIKCRGNEHKFSTMRRRVAHSVRRHCRHGHHHQYNHHHKEPITAMGATNRLMPTESQLSISHESKNNVADSCLVRCLTERPADNNNDNARDVRQEDTNIVTIAAAIQAAAAAASVANNNRNSAHGGHNNHSRHHSHHSKTNRRHLDNNHPTINLDTSQTSATSISCSSSAPSSATSTTGADSSNIIIPTATDSGVENHNHQYRSNHHQHQHQHHHHNHHHHRQNHHQYHQDNLMDIMITNQQITSTSSGSTSSNDPTQLHQRKPQQQQHEPPIYAKSRRTSRKATTAATGSGGPNTLTSRLIHMYLPKFYHYNNNNNNNTNNNGQPQPTTDKPFSKSNNAGHAVGPVAANNRSNRAAKELPLAGQNGSHLLHPQHQHHRQDDTSTFVDSLVKGSHHNKQLPTIDDLNRFLAFNTTANNGSNSRTTNVMSSSSGILHQHHTDQHNQLLAKSATHNHQSSSLHLNESKDNVAVDDDDASAAMANELPAPTLNRSCCHCVTCSNSWLFREDASPLPSSGVNGGVSGSGGGAHLKSSSQSHCPSGYYHPAPRGKLPFGAASSVNQFIQQHPSTAVTAHHRPLSMTNMLIASNSTNFNVQQSNRAHLDHTTSSNQTPTRHYQHQMARPFSMMDLMLQNQSSNVGAGIINYPSNEVSHERHENANNLHQQHNNLSIRNNHNHKQHQHHNSSSNTTMAFDENEENNYLIDMTPSTSNQHHHHPTVMPAPRSSGDDQTQLNQRSRSGSTSTKRNAAVAVTERQVAPKYAAPQSQSLFDDVMEEDDDHQHHCHSKNELSASSINESGQQLHSTNRAGTKDWEPSSGSNSQDDHANQSEQRCTCKPTVDDKPRLPPMLRKSIMTDSSQTTGNNSYYNNDNQLDENNHHHNHHNNHKKHHQQHLINKDKENRDLTNDQDIQLYANQQQMLRDNQEQHQPQ